VLSVVAGCSRDAGDAPAVGTASVALASSDLAVGAPLEMSYTFRIAPGATALADDAWVFTHFLDADGEQLWTDDHQPPTPPGQWKPGSTIAYTRTVFVPKLLYVGEVRVETGLYSRSSGERYALNGQDNGMRAYRVATFNMRMQTDPEVTLEQGWHDSEGAEPSVNPEWQWTKQAATVSFRNPGRDVVFYLDVDEPVQLPSGRHAEVRLGSQVLDAFALIPGRREVRRIPIAGAQLGTGALVAVTIAVDQTFVPSAVPALKSGDRRELGIRVFRAYVRPA
jgi:hypothetical protein